MRPFVLLILVLLAGCTTKKTPASCSAGLCSATSPSTTADSHRSTIDIVPNGNVIADGFSTATVNVIASSATGVAVAGAEVALDPGDAAVAIAPSSATTDAYGVARLTLSTTVSGTRTLHASIDGVALVATPTVRFVAGPPSATRSTLVGTTPDPVANGSDLAHFALTLRDAHGNACSQTLVTVTASGTAPLLVTPTVTTDDNGAATISLAAQSPGHYTVVAQTIDGGAQATAFFDRPWHSLALTGPTHLAVSPNDENTLYLAQDFELFKSSDGGAATTRVGYGLGAEITAVLEDPSDSATILAATSGAGLQSLATLAANADWQNSGFGTDQVTQLIATPTNNGAGYPLVAVDNMQVSLRATPQGAWSGAPIKPAVAVAASAFDSLNPTMYLAQFADGTVGDFDGHSWHVCIDQGSGGSAKAIAFGTANAPLVATSTGLFDVDLALGCPSASVVPTVFSTLAWITVGLPGALEGHAAGGWQQIGSGGGGATICGDSDVVNGTHDVFSRVAGSGLYLRGNSCVPVLKSVPQGRIVAASLAAPGSDVTLFAATATHQILSYRASDHRWTEMTNANAAVIDVAASSTPDVVVYLTGDGNLWTMAASDSSAQVKNSLGGGVSAPVRFWADWAAGDAYYLATSTLYRMLDGQLSIPTLTPAAGTVHAITRLGAVLYAGTDNGLYESSDGATFVPTTGVPFGGAVSEVAGSADALAVVAGSHVYRFDPQHGWVDATFNLLGYQPLRLLYAGDALYAAPAGGLFELAAGATTWSQLERPGWAGLGRLFADPQDTAKLFAVTGNGALLFTRTGGL